MTFIFAPLWGRASDRIGRRPVLIVGLIGSVGFYLLFGIATIFQSMTLLFIARIGAGIAGCHDSRGPGLYCRHHEPFKTAPRAWH